MASGEKGVLMIAYYFPPMGGAGVQRTAYFTHYLPEFGWCPHIVTIRNKKNYVQDQSLLRLLPEGLEIRRTSFWDADRITDAFWKIKLGDVARWIRNNFPIDMQVGWIYFALKECKKAIRENPGINMIYTTSAPFSSHIVGLFLHRKTGLPWVADFRDPWTLNMLMYSGAGFLKKKIDSHYEKMILETASHVIVSTERNRRLLLRQFHIPENKISTVTNGYDEKQFQDLEVQNNFGKRENIFSVVYIGNIYGEYNPKPILQAFIRMAKIMAPIPNLKFQYVGQSGHWFDNYRDDLARAGIELVVHEYMEHSKLISQYLLSTVLIFGLPRNLDYCLPGKIFEYIRSGRPIVATGNVDSQASELLDETGTGWVFDPDDIDGIAKKLLEIFEKWSCGETIVSPRWNLISKYERKKLTGKLADIFNLLSKRIKSNSRT